MTSILTRGNEIQVNSTSSGNQFSPVTTTLTDGRYIIVWQDSNALGTVVLFQMYDATGVKIGLETVVDTDASYPSITALENGGFAIAYQGASFDAEDIIIQLYDANGTAGFTIGPASENTGYQGQPSICGLQGGGYVVIWTSLNQDQENTYGIFASIIGPNFTPQIQIGLGVNDTTIGDQTQSSVTALTDGTFVVSWESYNQDGSLQGIYAKHFSAFGSTLNDEFLVNATTSGAQSNSRIIAIINGGYVVVWQGEGAQFNNSDTSGIFYQMFDANDERIGGETLVNSFTFNDQIQPDVTSLSDGGFVIVWSSINQDSMSGGIYGQRIDENGSKIGPEFQINSFIYGEQIRPTVTALDDGGFVVAWQSALQDGSGDGIFSRRYAAASTLSGTQYLYGTAYADLLDGGIGNDSMYGGQGDDTYIVNTPYDLVSENLDEGDDTIEASITYSIATKLDIENLTLTGTSTINATGNDGSNVITGNKGNNTLSGNAGFDLIHGGEGKDMIFGGYDADVLHGDDGNDYLMGEDEADLLYGDAGQDTLIGGEGSDTLYGGDQNDLLYGTVGADYFYGDSGSDTFSGSNYTSGINASLASGRSRIQTVVSYLSGIENLIGSNFDDKLYGDAGNNVIDGAAGADTMVGGTGNDVYYYDNDGDTITETDGQGDDLLYSSVNVALGSRSIETVILTGSADLTFSSNTQATEVWGNSGNNNINAGLGADTIYGSLGNDTIYVDDAGDLVVENNGEGTDRVSSTITYSLTANVENLTLTGTANINGTGNSLANSIVGNNGSNVLDGGSGSASDSLRGGLGNDTYVFNLGFGIDDITSETGGADTILFGAGITAAMIITQDVGADRYYAINDGVHQASACANRVKIVGGASGTIETIAYTPPAAPAMSPAASSAQLVQAIAVLPVSGASASATLVQNATSATPNLGVTSLIQGQRFAA